MGRNRAQSRSPDRTRIWEAGAVSELDTNEQGTREQGISDLDTNQNRRVGDVRAWVNGVRVDATGPSIAAVDHGITVGAGPLGSDRDTSPLTYIVTAGPTAPNLVTAKVVVVPWTRNERSATAGLKTTSYAENVVALAYAKDRGGDEALFANSVGNLCDGTGSNVFVVVDGEILTPDLASGPLAGVTRDLVIEWCREAGLTVHAEPLPMSILTQAAEVFITSSVKDVMAVHAIDDRPFPTPGPV